MFFTILKYKVVANLFYLSVLIDMYVLWAICAALVIKLMALLWGENYQSNPM